MKNEPKVVVFDNDMEVLHLGVLNEETIEEIEELADFGRSVSVEVADGKFLTFRTTGITLMQLHTGAKPYGLLQQGDQGQRQSVRAKANNS